MRLGGAVAALLLVSLTACVATRLSVFREDFNGVPGRTFVVVHGDDDNGGSGGVLPVGLEWLFQQMALLRVMQSHMLLNSMPPLPNAMAPDGAEDTLRRVRCQRMRQAIIDEDQGIWGSTFGGDSDISTTRPALGLASETDDDSDAPRCYDVHGELVACNSEDAVMQDNWLDIERPVETTDVASLASISAPGNPRTKDAATNTDPWGDAADGSLAAASLADGDATPRQLQPADIFFAAGGQEGEDGINGGDEPWRRGSMGRNDRNGDVDDIAMGSSSSSDGDLLFSGEEAGMQRPWEGLQQEQELPPYHRRPPGLVPASGGALLAAGGVLCAALVTVGALVLLAVAVMRRRCTPYGDVDAVLVAPLLAKGGAAVSPVKVYGIKVAAAEAQRDAVQGIDTSAALLKGEGLARPQ